MTKKYALDLTADEALALVMLSNSGVGGGFIAEQVHEIADALTRIDTTLAQAQRTKWEDIGRPEFDLTGTPLQADAKAEWTCDVVGRETVN